MAEITATSMTGPEDRVLTKTTLGASDTFTYTSAKAPLLILDNVTVGPLTVTIDGDTAPAELTVAGVGNIDLSAGFVTEEIAAGACVAIPLNSIARYLSGTIAVTGGTGIEAMLLEMS